MIPFPYQMAGAGRVGALSDADDIAGIVWSQYSVYGSLTATAANMRDGNFTTGGATHANGNPWIKADLGAARTVNKIRLAGGNMSGWGAVSAYLNGRNLQYSTNDSDWTTFVSVSGASDSAPYFVDISVPDITARYWRLSLNNYIATTEFRFWAAP